MYFGFSDKLCSWIFALVFIDFCVYAYIISSFDNWVQLCLNITLPLQIWQAILFASFAPDDILAEIIGEQNVETYRHPTSPRHQQIRSSGDH
ncbi:unnamed protein product [Caenorhabditis angaria]|uniref:Uncharacterized protein n=1 Tax=Caenorhabditis angaria TaxID=860376 RepID=A0A9P1IHL7_9PELO|nr:unnamed protein product [Caenorhabditis angaria]